MIRKNISFILVFIVLCSFPFLNVFAEETATVYNETTLKEAISNHDITKIVLSEDIETHEKINITRDLAIDGNNHTIRYAGTFKGTTDKTIWDSIYVIQVYLANVTIKDIKLTGGNAGLLVNGANVKLEGNIDLSGNGWGGIEIAKGIGVTDTPKLELDSTTKITNSDETTKKPTIWVPDDTNGALMEVDGKEISLEAGAEFSIAKVEDMFNLNPETGDMTIWFGIMGGIAIVALGYAIKTLKDLKL